MARYGKFSREGSEYIITRFDTPRPWINLIGNETYGLYLSQCAFGYSFYRDSSSVKLNYADVTGYVPTHPQTGKFVFLRDMDNGHCWPNLPMHDARGYSGYRCVHGQGYSLLSARRQGIQTDFLAFVPQGTDPVEIWQVTLRNCTKRVRHIKVFPYQQWLMSAPTGITDTLTYTRASYRSDLNAIVARMTNPTSPLQYDAFMTADFQPEEYDCNYDRFMGVYAPLSAPEAVTAGAATNTPASGERMCGVLTRTFELPPGASVTFRVLTGASQADADIRSLTARYLPAEACAAALRGVQAYWQQIREIMRVKTPDATINLMANSWIKWQNYHTTRHARGAYRGFRDLLQDAMGFTPLQPGFTRDAIAEVLQHQYASGLCVRGWNPVSGSLDVRKYRDSPCWIPLTLSAYLRETGDLAFLNTPVNYLDSGSATVFEHAWNGMRCLYETRAPNGLCVIGEGDWNDSLNEVALRGIGQSIWLTVAAVYAMNTLAEIAAADGRPEPAGRLRAWANELKNAVNQHGWDGRWYLYAITDDGVPVGSDRNEQGKIHLNVQTWAIFAGVAEGARIAPLLQVIDVDLGTRHGPVLMHPAYTGYIKGIGKVSGKNPGMAENGPIYSHGVLFKMLADFKLGRGDQALDSFLKVCPASPANTDEPDRFQGEPFTATRYLVGPACPERFGAAPYSYHTAMPAWSLHLLYEYMLGVRPSFHELIIDPCIPACWDKFEVIRPFRGATYRVRVTNPAHVQTGVRRVRVDGKLHPSNRVPIFSDGKLHTVDVEMGKTP
jgi:cellobiose phosphorylase